MSYIDKSSNGECEFCDELMGGQRNAFVSRYRSKGIDRLVPTGQSFILMPSVGQITEGHVLLIPKRHVTAMVKLTSIETEELDNLCRRVKRFLHNAYGECIFFEHGIRKTGSGGCGIEHAHIHAIPVHGSAVLDVLMKSFQGSRINQIHDIRAAVPQESSYLFFENCQGDRYVFAAPCIPSQYMRKVICKLLGERNWDWRDAGYEPELVATLKRLSAEFSEG